MGLRIEDKWIWDLWLAPRHDMYHVFYLQAPRSLGDADLRHGNATVGHAVSEDLVNWEVQPNALGPGPRGSWDGLATWTGSTIAKDDAWHMFYTGASMRNGVVTQQIGSAVSRDLISWTKRPGPLVTASPRWYETHDSHEWFEEAWRDPWVFEGTDGRYHALITARVSHGQPDGRGVIGHAASSDLEHWEVLAPLSDSGEFGHLEVSQLVEFDDHCVLVFSCQGDQVSEKRRARVGEDPVDATYVLKVESALGPYRLSEAQPALPPDYYSGRLVQTFSGKWFWLAFRNFDDDGEFIGELSDPMPYL